MMKKPTMFVPIPPGYMLPVLEYLRNLTAGPGLDQPLIGFFMVKIVGVAIPRPVARGVRKREKRCNCVEGVSERRLTLTSVVALDAQGRVVGFRVTS